VNNKIAWQDVCYNGKRNPSKKHFEFELNFSNSTKYEKFLKKVPNIIKIMPYFPFKFFFNIWFRSTKNTLQNGHFIFSRRWPHIFYMLFEKSYDMVLWFLLKNNWKYFENIENATFYFIQICPHFVSSLLLILWIIIFATKLRFGRNPSKPSLIQK
jgi:hypothetical protein